MNRARELALHRRVVDGVIAERHVSDDGIEVIIRKRRFLKPLGEYRGIGIELLRDAGGDGIQFHAGPVAALHGLRHQAEEMPHAHGRLQYLRALAQAQTVQAAPDRLDDLRRGEMRVRRRGARRFIFIVGQSSSCTASAVLLHSCGGTSVPNTLGMAPQPT